MKEFLRKIDFRCPPDPSQSLRFGKKRRRRRGKKGKAWKGWKNKSLKQNLQASAARKNRQSNNSKKEGLKGEILKDLKLND